MSDADLLAAFIMQTQKGILQRILGSTCSRRRGMTESEMRAAMLGKTRAPPSGERQLEAVAPPAKRRLYAVARLAMRPEVSCAGQHLVRKLTDETGPGEYYARQSMKFAKFAVIWNDKRLGGVFHVAYGKYGTSPTCGLGTLFVPSLQKGRHSFLPEPKLRAMHADSDRVLGGKTGELIEVEDHRLAVKLGTNRDRITVLNYVSSKRIYCPQATLKMAPGDFVNLLGIYIWPCTRIGH